MCVSVLVILLASEGFGHLFKIQKIFRTSSLQKKKKDDFLDEGHSTLYVGILPGIITVFPEDYFNFFALFITEKLIPRYLSSNTSGMKFPSFHYSVFLRLVSYKLFPCTYITVPHQRTQNNSQEIRVHFAWVH